MKMTDWKDTAELIGIAAIVASLIFVGLQMKQSQEIAAAAQYQERASFALEVYVNQTNNQMALESHGESAQRDFLTAATPHGLDDWAEGLSTSEIGYHIVDSYILITLVDNLFFQFESGFLDEESWTAYRARLKALLRYRPDFQELLSRTAPYWRTSFLDEVERIRIEIEEESQKP